MTLHLIPIVMIMSKEVEEFVTIANTIQQVRFYLNPKHSDSLLEEKLGIRPNIRSCSLRWISVLARWDEMIIQKGT